MDLQDAPAKLRELAEDRCDEGELLAHAPGVGSAHV